MNTNISRRDYFAAKAMQASTFQQFAVAIVKAIAPDNQRVTLGIAPETTAREAYRIADAIVAGLTVASPGMNATTPAKVRVVAPEFVPTADPNDEFDEGYRCADRYWRAALSAAGVEVKEASK